MRASDTQPCPSLSLSVRLSTESSRRPPETHLDPPTPLPCNKAEDVEEEEEEEAEEAEEAEEEEGQVHAATGTATPILFRALSLSLSLE